MQQKIKNGRKTKQNLGRFELATKLILLVRHHLCWNTKSKQEIIKYIEGKCFQIDIMIDWLHADRQIEFLNQSCYNDCSRWVLDLVFLSYKILLQQHDNGEMFVATITTKRQWKSSQEIFSLVHFIFFPWKIRNRVYQNIIQLFTNISPHFVHYK